MSDDLKTVVLEELQKIAPDGDYEALEDDDSLRDELDLDSMDFLKFVQGLHARTGVEVPELDYPRLDSVEDAVDYLAARR